MPVAMPTTVVKKRRTGTWTCMTTTRAPSLPGPARNGITSSLPIASKQVSRAGARRRGRPTRSRLVASVLCALLLLTPCRFRSVGDPAATVRQADVSSLLQKRSTPTALPAALGSEKGTAAGQGGNDDGDVSAAAEKRRARRQHKGKGRAAVADSAAELDLVAAHVAAEAAAHRAKLEQHLSAREERLAQLLRASRELELQRHLMGNGKKEKAVVVRNPKDQQAGEDDWWMQGVKGAKKGTPDEHEAKLPMADEGVATGARVWVSFPSRPALDLG